jgi:DNA-binding LytR/AlgR family response regulator
MKYRLIIDKDKEEEIIAIVHSPSSLTREIENLVKGYSGEDCIMAQGEDEIRKLPFSEIECITVIDRRVVAIDSRGKRYFLKDRLRDLEEFLPSYFIRINKSAIANEHSIQRFDAAFSGGVDAVFKCGYREYVSRRCFSQIRRRYEGI